MTTWARSDSDSRDAVQRELDARFPGLPRRSASSLAMYRSVERVGPKHWRTRGYDGEVADWTAITDGPDPVVVKAHPAAVLPSGAANDSSDLPAPARRSRRRA